MNDTQDMPATTAMIGALAAGLVAVLTICTPSTWAAATIAHSTVGALAAVVALAIGWILALRLAAATFAALVGLLPGALGYGGRTVARRLTPVLVRRLVHTVLGATVVAGPLATGGVSWAAEPNAGLPNLDRVASVPALAPPTPVAARQLPAGHTDEEVAEAWPRWYAANRAVIGADPSAIQPGQRLVAPAPESGASS